MLRYFGGNGAVRLIAADPDGLLMERADDDVSLRMMAISGGDDRAAEILADCVASSARTARMCRSGWAHSAAGLVPVAVRAQAELPILARCADVRAACWQSRARSSCCTAICITTTFFRFAWLACHRSERADRRAQLRSGEPARQPMAAWRDRAPDRQDAASLELYASRLDLDPRRVLGFALAHAGLSASWSLEDGGDPFIA